MIKDSKYKYVLSKDFILYYNKRIDTLSGQYIYNMRGSLILKIKYEVFFNRLSSFINKIY